MTMASVELDLAEFRTWFPGLSEEVAPDSMVGAFFSQAEEIVGNTDETSFAPYNPDANPPQTKRKALLYYATCHLLTLAIRGDQPGRVASASQGSVSTSFDLIKSNSQLSQWWNQTGCGATYWALTAPYRMGGRLYGIPKNHPWG